MSTINKINAVIAKRSKTMKKWTLILSRDGKTWTGQYRSRIHVTDPYRARSMYTTNTRSAARFASKEEAEAVLNKGPIFANGEGFEWAVEI